MVDPRGNTHYYFKCNNGYKNQPRTQGYNHDTEMPRKPGNANYAYVQTMTIRNKTVVIDSVSSLAGHSRWSHLASGFDELRDDLKGSVLPSCIVRIPDVACLWPWPW